MDEKLREVAREAAEAFWAKVAERYPEAKTGELDVITTVRLDNVMREAVMRWVKYNVPVADAGR